MSSNQLVIRKKNPATRCDICHMSDQFDPDTETCLRCCDVPIPTTAITNPTSMVPPSTNTISPFQSTVSKIIAYAFLSMVGGLFLTILSGIFKLLSIAIMFAIVSFISGSVFVISLGILAVYMVVTVLASIIQSIYDSLRARS